ncbi:Putative ankyrin repeat protein TV1425 [Linum perenne]
MLLEPPPFQEADRCDVCKCAFGAFRRRFVGSEVIILSAIFVLVMHNFTPNYLFPPCSTIAAVVEGHCVTNTPQSKRSVFFFLGLWFLCPLDIQSITLPQFGIYSNVRVCADCISNGVGSWAVNHQATTRLVNSITDQVCRLDIEAEVEPQTKMGTQYQTNATVIECKCGMPLCICQAPATTTETASIQAKAASATASASASHLHPKPKKMDAISKTRASSSSNKPSSIFNHGQMTSGVVDKPQKDYEASGEGLREAIKDDDSAAVRKLVSQGVDANYQDRQGMSLLHLAAVFNRTDIVFILMESGASLDCRNAQGETPLDCAPATLQYKMRKKIQESGEADPQTSV